MLGNIYITLLLLFILSVTGILGSDKYDNNKMFYGSVALFIFSIAVAILLWLASVYILLGFTA